MNSANVPDVFGRDCTRSPREFQSLENRIMTRISHEFRTPLTSIIGFAELLAEGKMIDDDQRVEYANHIKNEGLRLSKLIADCLERESREQNLLDDPIKKEGTNKTV